MGALAEQLRRLREKKGANLEEAAAATKVGVHHLQALERGDFNALPGDVYVRGFVRAYGDFLGAETDGLLALYRRDREGLESDERPAAERTVQEMSRILATAPHGTMKHRGLALRFSLDPNLGKHVLRIGALAAAVAGVVALAMLLIGRRQADAIPSQAASPLRASRSATEAPATTSAPASVTPPVPAAAPPTSAPAGDAPSAPAPPVVEAEAKRADVPVVEDGLQVPEHGVGSRVESSRLVGQAARFEEGAAVWFWTRVDGGRGGQVVRHVWLHDDREVHSVELDLGGAQWRTWSRKTLRPGSVGHWSVEARDAYGRVLASDEFECVNR